MIGKAYEYLLVKYPDHSDKIIDLYRKDEEFRILCEDYQNIMLEIEKCRLNAVKDREIEREFLHANMELEKEIIHYLEVNQ